MIKLLPCFAIIATSVSATVFNVNGDASDASIGLNESDAPVIGWTGEQSLVLGDDNNAFNKADRQGLQFSNCQIWLGKASAQPI